MSYFKVTHFETRKKPGEVWLFLFGQKLPSLIRAFFLATNTGSFHISAGVTWVRGNQTNLIRKHVFPWRGYAMTAFRLPISTFRKLNVCFGLWEKFPSNKLNPNWRRSLFCQTSTVNYRRCFIFSPVRLSALRLSPEYISVLSLRNKSSKSSKRSRQNVQEEEEEEDEDESNLEDEFENDPYVVKDYKDLEKVVQSLRYDVILKAGLDMARNKVEDAFYNNELRLNGEKLWKKSRTVKLGDTLDLIIGEDKETGTAVVMRVVLKKLSDKTESEKYKVILRRWKNLKVPKQDVLK